MRLTWRYILDGYAIAGVVQRQGEDGAWTTYVMDFHYYDRDRDRWVVEYVNPMTPWEFGSQAQEEVGGVRVVDTSIVVMTGGEDYILRETFLNITADHHTYRGEVSRDGGESWLETNVIEVSRIED